MAVTIKYKELSSRLIKRMTLKQLNAVKDEIMNEFNNITGDSYAERYEKKQLMAQIGLIAGVIAILSKDEQMN